MLLTFRRIRATDDASTRTDASRTCVSTLKVMFRLAHRDATVGDIAQGMIAAQGDMLIAATRKLSFSARP